MLPKTPYFLCLCLLSLAVSVIAAAWMATKMDTAKAFLRQTNADGVSVYSHLTEVLATLLQKQPDNALDMLEGVSLECKKKHYSPEGTAAPEAPAEVPPPLSDVEQASSAWHEANAKLLGKPSGDEDAAPEGEVTDILAERAMFEWFVPRSCGPPGGGPSTPASLTRPK